MVFYVHTAKKRLALSLFYIIFVLLDKKRKIKEYNIAKHKHSEKKNIFCKYINFTYIKHEIGLTNVVRVFLVQNVDAKSHHQPSRVVEKTCTKYSYALCLIHSS